VPTKTTSD
jgi:hypothetical protein